MANATFARPYHCAGKLDSALDRPAKRVAGQDGPAVRLPAIGAWDPAYMSSSNKFYFSGPAATSTAFVPPDGTVKNCRSAPPAFIAGGKKNFFFVHFSTSVKLTS